MAEFLEKHITKKRTGANLLGINVETRTGFTIGNPATEHMLNALEKIAKKAEQAEIDTARQSFWLDIEERNLKLQNKLSDPNIYGNQESFEEAMKEIENQRKENEKLLAGNIYFTRDEKELAKKQLNNGSFNIYAKAMEKRNTVYTQQQVEKAVYEMNRLVTIGSQLDMNDVESQKMIVDRVIDGTKTLQSLGNWTDERAMEFANRNMMAIEQGRFEKDLNNIINNPNITLDQKKAKMQQLFNVGNNTNNIKAMAQSYTDRLGYTGKLAEESVKYFEASIKNVYDNVKGQAYKNLEIYEKEQKIDQERIRQEEIERVNKTNKAFNSGSYWGMLEAKSEIIPTYADILTAETQAINLKNPSFSPAYEMYGKTLKELNQSGMYIKDFLPQDTIDNMNEQINKRIEDLGQTRFEATYEVLSGITKNLPEEVAETLVNSFAVKNGEYQQNEYKIMLKGIKNPTDSEFLKVKKFNTILERGGNISNTDLKIATQVPVIAQMVNKVVDNSNGRITPIVATKTIMRLYLGTNSITNIVPIGESKSEKDYAEYLIHIFTDGNYKIKSELNKNLGNDDDIVNMIINLKQDRKILYPAIMKGGY